MCGLILWFEKIDLRYIFWKHIRWTLKAINRTNDEGFY